MGKSQRQAPTAKRSTLPRHTPNGGNTKRENLRRLMDQRGANRLAKQLGYSNASFLSQMAGPNPIRGVTEKTARRFELAIDLPVGALDTPTSGDAPPARVANRESAVQPSQAASVDLTSDVIRLVGKLFDEEGIDVSGVRFSDVVALAIMDAVEHDSQARPEHVRSLVRLVKPQ